MLWVTAAPGLIAAPRPPTPRPADGRNRQRMAHRHSLFSSMPLPGRRRYFEWLCRRRSHARAGIGRDSPGDLYRILRPPRNPAPRSLLHANSTTVLAHPDCRSLSLSTLVGTNERGGAVCVWWLAGSGSTPVYPSTRLPAAYLPVFLSTCLPICLAVRPPPAQEKTTSAAGCHPTGRLDYIRIASGRFPSRRRWMHGWMDNRRIQRRTDM